MIKLGPMKIGIRKPQFQQFSLHWGDTLVDGWDSFVGWVHVQRMMPYLRPRAVNFDFMDAADSIRFSTHILASESNRQRRNTLSGNRIHTVIVDEVDWNVTAEIAEE
jgi:hypothetical protein